uniref:Uncharacterized protein n=1 Tax=Oryza rufipogon TaxID=4529 RepID=A0A0E0NJ72_ORYRU
MIIVLVYTGGENVYGATGAEYSIPPKITFPASEATTFEDVKNEIYGGLKYSETEYSLLIPLYETRSWQMIFDMTSARNSWRMVELYIEFTPTNSGFSQNHIVSEITRENLEPTMATVAENIVSASHQSPKHGISPKIHDVSNYAPIVGLSSDNIINEAQENSQDDGYVDEETEREGDMIEEDESDGEAEEDVNDNTYGQPVVKLIKLLPLVGRSDKHPLYGKPTKIGSSWKIQTCPYPHTCRAPADRLDHAQLTSAVIADQCKDDDVVKTFKWVVKKKKPRRFNEGMEAISKTCPDAIAYLG